jgi:hypothetical protein
MSLLTLLPYVLSNLFTRGLGHLVGTLRLVTQITSIHVTAEGNHGRKVVAAWHELAILPLPQS